MQPLSSVLLFQWVLPSGPHKKTSSDRAFLNLMADSAPKQEDVQVIGALYRIVLLFLDFGSHKKNLILLFSFRDIQVQLL
jgi:hypothetical protein